MDDIRSLQTLRPVPQLETVINWSEVRSSTVFLLFKTSSLFKNVFFLFIYFWSHWVFLAVRGLSLVVESRGYISSCSVQASHRSDFFHCKAQALGAWASVVAESGFSSCDSWALEHRLSSCGPWALLLHSMWTLPSPGIEAMDPALALYSAPCTTSYPL